MQFATMVKKGIFITLAAVFFVFQGCREKLIRTYKGSPAKGLTTGKAMVVSAHPLASEAGVQILKAGGNAVDAAIAVQFALAVVYPVAGNIGGGGFMVVRMNDGRSFALDFREKAPGAAGRDMYLDKQGRVIENLSLLGHKACGVPGSVDGMVEAHKKLGHLPWKDLVEPAIRLASGGFRLTGKDAGTLNHYKASFENLNGDYAGYITGSTWKAGDLFVQEDLAHTLERIRDHQRAGFYKGETASRIAEEMRRGGGLITKRDLENYHSVWRKPVTGSYKEFRIISMPPPSSGGIALIQLLKLIRPFPLKKWGWGDPKTIHVMVASEKLVYADRAEYLGDPDYYPVPQQELISDAYLDQRRKTIDMERGRPSAEIAAGKIRRESEQTTHFSIVDTKGNAVAVTTTLNGGFGSKVLVKGTGFFLNNEMDDFSIKPGYPNMFGLIGGEANAIAPGKRMLSSMTPTILEKNGELYMVVGTPGGATIITSVFQTVLNVVEHGMDMQTAVNALRFHHQWLPDVIKAEEGVFTGKVIQRLEKYGYVIEYRNSIGRVDAILIRPDGKLEGGADPRGDDTAAGF